MMSGEGGGAGENGEELKVAGVVVLSESRGDEAEVEDGLGDESSTGGFVVRILIELAGFGR